MVPSVRVEHVRALAPEDGEAVDGVGVDVDGRAGGDVVAAEGVVGDGLADRHGDGGDVAQGLAADVVQVGQAVGVEAREAIHVVAGAGVEEEGVVLVDFGAEAGLDLRMGAEQVDCPGNAGGGGVVAGAQKGHHLVAHGFKREAGVAGRFPLHVILHDQGDDVFIFGVGGCVFGLDDFVGLGDDDVAGFQHIAVHFRGEVLGDGDESGEAMEDPGEEVKGEDKAIGFADRSLRVLERVEVGAEARFADDVQRGAVQPFQDFDRFRPDTFGKHVAFPEL